jgi:hypothetical protein
VLAFIEFPVMPGGELQRVDPGEGPRSRPMATTRRCTSFSRTLRRAHCKTDAERVDLEPVINAGLHGTEQRRRIDQFN